MVKKTRREGGLIIDSTSLEQGRVLTKHGAKMTARRTEQQERVPGFDKLYPAAGEAKTLRQLNRKNLRRYQSPSVQRAIKAAAAKVTAAYQEAAE